MSALATQLAAVPKRKIGNAEVFSIGYGTMGLSAFYAKPMPDEERLKLLDAVYKSGCNYWDSADIYADSEDLLARWFEKSGKRSSIFLATKFGFTTGLSVDGSPEYVHRAVAKSLSRLRIDYIDLYYLHRPDPKTPIEITVAAMAELVKQGKIKYIGLSECSAETIRRAHAVHPIAAVQVEYSPFTLDIEDPAIGVRNVCQELGIAVVAYSPLGRGVLSGQIKSPDEFAEDDFRKHIPRYSKENFPKILALAAGLQKIGDRHKATAGQVTLAWLLAQGEDVIPIPGTTKVKYLEENLGAALVKLSPEEIEEVRHIAKEADLASTERYPPGMQEQLFANTPALPH